MHADHAASHLGKAQGLANMVRAVPHHSLQRVVALPRDLLAQHSVVYESVLRGSRDQPVKDVVFEIAARAKQHLDKVSMKHKFITRMDSHLILTILESSPLLIGAIPNLTGFLRCRGMFIYSYVTSTAWAWKATSTITLA